MQLNDYKQFTYPIAMLLDFPGVPSQEELGGLREAFSKTSSTHPFLDRLKLKKKYREEKEEKRRREREGGEKRNERRKE